MKFRCCVSLISVATMLIPASSAVYAAGFRLPNQGAFATARGNAFIATADDPSAIYYNAAGLTQIPQSELQVGVHMIDFNVDFEQSGSEYSNENVWQPVPQAFYAHKFESFSAGVGIYAPFGLGNKWGDSSPFTSLTTEAAIQYITVAPVIAYELNNQISVGGGLTINYANAEIEQGIGIFPNDRIKFSGNDTSFGWTISAMWKPSEQHQFGANYRSAVTHKLKGDTAVSFVPTPTDSQLYLNLPDTLGLGYSYRPSDQWNFELDLEWGGWNRLGSPVLENTPLGDVPYPFEWDNGLIYQVGATRYYDRWAVSAGFDLNESVQTQPYYNPAVSDADRNWFNIGLSNLQGRKPWSITYQYGWSDRTVSSRIPNPLTLETANGRYKTRVHALAFSWGFRL